MNLRTVDIRGIRRTFKGIKVPVNREDIFTPGYCLSEVPKQPLLPARLSYRGLRNTPVNLEVNPGSIGPVHPMFVSTVAEEVSVAYFCQQSLRGLAGIEYDDILEICLREEI